MAFHFNIGEHVVTHGQPRSITLPVARNSMDQQIGLTVHGIAGAHPGPVVLVAAGSHGEELWSIDFVRRIHERFARDASDLHGGLLLAPLLSSPSFLTGTRHTPSDYHNLNRVFPGVPAGRGWLTEMIADVISRQILPYADHLFDYHGGGSDTTIEYHYTSQPGTPHHDVIHRVARASGARVLWEVNETRSTLSAEFLRLGKPAYVPEIGGGGTFHLPDLHTIALQRFENMLRAIEVLPGEPSFAGPRALVRAGRAMRPSHGGIYLPAVGLEVLGQQVPGGTLLGQVVSASTFEVLDELIAPYPRTEVMQVRNRISRVEPGDYAYLVGDADSGHPLPAPG
jgi:predicted deacylase